ncbi:hypothetical protein GCM10022213_19300 [Parerythrobacter jejuensis]
MIKSPHPFPARMAPELAIAALEGIGENATILDPMSGSGVVVRQAIERGHTAIGYDLDPLAVLMTKVWSTHVPSGALTQYCDELINVARNSDRGLDDLPWACEKTKDFMEFWFAEPQRSQLAKIAWHLNDIESRRLRRRERDLLDVLRLCLSRTIITKSGGASLASDTSHSRPHRTRAGSEYDVFWGLRDAAVKVERICNLVPKAATFTVRHGDARDLRGVRSQSIDAIVTSPPYLNAIDYMRGHKLALVWLGHAIGSLSQIRSHSIGAEKSIDPPLSRREIDGIRAIMLDGDTLSSRQLGMIDRYICDLDRLASRCARVLKPSGKATYVVGNSCLKGTFVSNSDCMKALSEKHGLTLVDESERKLPENRRYLPVGGSTANPLQKRMRTETVLTFQKLA